MRKLGAALLLGAAAVLWSVEPSPAPEFSPAVAVSAAAVTTACGSSDTQVLFTSSTSCAGSANFTWSGSTLGVTGRVAVTPTSGNPFSSTGFAVDGTGKATALDLFTTGGAAVAGDGSVSVYNQIKGNDASTTTTDLLQVSSITTSTTVGDHAAIQSLIQINTSPTTGGNYVADWAFAFGNANVGGISGTPVGHLFGINPQVRLTSNATFWQSITGGEFDIEVDAGVTVHDKYGLNITTIGSDAVQGTVIDAAILIGSIPAPSLGWKTGILFSNFNGGGLPLRAGSTAIDVSTAMTVTHGINFTNLTCSSDCFKSPGFSVNGSGLVASTTLQLAPLTTDNAMLISPNPTDGHAIIQFNNTIATSNATIDSQNGAITVAANGTGLVVLNSNAIIPNANNSIQLGGSSNIWSSVWSDVYVIGGSTPTTSGTCAAPAMAGGNTAGTITTTTGCSDTQTIILTFALTATTGWACNAVNRTAVARPISQSASSTTTATFRTPSTTTSNNDVIQYSCLAY